MPVKTVNTPDDALDYLVEKYGPKDKKFIRAVRAAIRKRVPTANELLYEYNGFMVIAYSSTDSAPAAVLSFAARDDGISFYLTNGPRLPDPKGLLKGTGKEVRFVELKKATDLKHPDIEALIVAAIDMASVPLPSKGKGSLIVKSLKTVAVKKTPAKKSSK